MANTTTDRSEASAQPAQPAKQTWSRPQLQAFDTRAEISAYSGDRDIPWTKR